MQVAAGATRALLASLMFAFLLLVGSGLLIRSFFEMQHMDTGFNTLNVITAGLPISEKRFARVRPAGLAADCRRWSRAAEIGRPR